MEQTNISETRLSVRLKGPLAVHADKQVNSALYESHSEYVRDLIRRDMSGRDYDLREAILQGYGDVGAGRYSEDLSHDDIMNQAVRELQNEGHDISKDS